MQRGGGRSVPFRGNCSPSKQRGEFDTCCEEQEKLLRASGLRGRGGEEMDGLPSNGLRDSAMGGVTPPPRNKKMSVFVSMRRRRCLKVVFACLLLGFALAAANILWRGSSHLAVAEEQPRSMRVPAEVAWKIQASHWASVSSNRTLVIYVFSNTDSFYLQNLIRFVRTGIAKDNADGSEGEPVDYFIFLNGIDEDVKALMPALPTTRARYIDHENECFDFGTIGWAFSQPGMIRLWLYKYILWLNSSVRGPYLPPGHHPGIRWHSILTSRLDNEVKMVGATVSCQYTPHIQSYVVATDQVGLGVLLTNKTIFGCHKTLLETVFASELGSSTEILNAGFNIDTLEKTYQGLDWRKVTQETRFCWNQLNPVHHYDIFQDSDNIIFELMFIKVKKEYMDHPLCMRAKAIDRASIDQKCFDWRFYCRQLTGLDCDEEKAWAHFSGEGMNKGRSYRMVC